MYSWIFRKKRRIDPQPKDNSHRGFFAADFRIGIPAICRPKEYGGDDGFGSSPLGWVGPVYNWNPLCAVVGYFAGEILQRRCDHSGGAPVNHERPLSLYPPSTLLRRHPLRGWLVSLISLLSWAYRQHMFYFPGPISNSR